MSQIMNWLCYICVSFLVLEMMFYLCKDVIKVSKNKKVGKTKVVGNRRVKDNQVIYGNKIAK
ncbi:MAG: hypothetical protein ACRDD7_10695 [Peptostreptococcaceae bacterium]